MKVAIVAGEKSGDFLGAELIKVIKSKYPQAEFVGLCGALMQDQGATTLADMEKISIFGLDGLFSSLREIVAIRKKLYRYFLSWHPDVFIGIDVPDFNLTLAGKLKRLGVPTVHYVSPTVWAWRGGRIKKIRRCIDLMLTLFPFEKSYYQQNNMSVEYVGHPLAKQILHWQIDSTIAQRFAGDESTNIEHKLIAVLPGSRMSEVSRLAPIMLEAIARLSKQHSGLKFVIPAANKKIHNYIIELPNFDASLVELIEGSSRDVLALSHLVILASGTAALEAALFAKPMVVMYKVSNFSAIIYKNSITVEHFSMPNHLIHPPVVPELIQQQANVENLVIEVNKLLNDADYYQTMRSALAKIAPKLNTDSSELACRAIDALLQ